jgi:hypothetical protein
MIYGTDHFLSVCAPPGWVLDNESLVRSGIYAVFYRKEFSYQEAMARHTLMYVNIVLKDKGQNTAKEMMELDLAETKRKSPNLVVEKTKPILIPVKTGNEISAPVQTFFNDYQGSYESVAYIENDKTITLLVLSSISEQLWREDYPSFGKLVQSYAFLGSNVHVEK